MIDGKKFPQMDLILALSESLDLISPVLVGHHLRVAFIAFNIGLELELDIEELNDLILSALLHDIGGLSLSDRLNALKFEIENPHFHAEVGYCLIKMYKPFDNVAKMVKYHHVRWSERDNYYKKGIEIPLNSFIINLADRIDVLTNREQNLMEQREYIIEKIIKEKGEKFHPDIVEAFLGISERKYFWKDLHLSAYIILLKDIFRERFLNIDDLLDISKLFEKVIDFRSRFTATHSTGVTYVAQTLSQKVGFSSIEEKMIQVAGRLHDLGKLAIPNEILEKPGKLSKKEFNIIKSHALHTYSILKNIKGFEEIHEWAGYHHEKINGIGYPFNKRGKELSLGSRIMTIADIFTAISEDRPYRKGMDKESILHILNTMAKNNEIDYDILNILKDNYEEINHGRVEVQRSAFEGFEKFWNEVNTRNK